MTNKTPKCTLSHLLQLLDKRHSSKIYIFLMIFLLFCGFRSMFFTQIENCSLTKQTKKNSCEFQLHGISVTISEYTSYGMIWKMWISNTKPVANCSSHNFFAAVVIKKYQTSERCGRPIQMNGSFCSIMKSRIIMNVTLNACRRLKRSCYALWGVLKDTGALTEHFRQRVNRDVQYEINNVFLEQWSM